MTNPTIRVGDQSRLNLHAAQMLQLPSQSPYGNLSLKWIRIVSRLIRVNGKILAAYRLHTHVVSQTEDVSQSIEELWDSLEEIVYWLRKTADELICLSFLCEACRRGEPIPSRIKVDCIGKLLETDNTAMRSQFAAHLTTLELLNEISNAYKHSFINSDLSLIGRNEPVCYALTLKHNDLSKKEGFVEVALSTVVRDFDSFFQTAKKSLRTWSRSDAS